MIQITGYRTAMNK